jgi:hypothetical protein
MRIGRGIIIPAIVTLGVAGSSLAFTMAPAATAAVHTSSVHVAAQGPLVVPGVYCHT